MRRSPATDCFLSGHEHRVGCPQFAFLAVADPVQEVDQHSDRQPDEEPEPRQEAQVYHEFDVAEYAQGRYVGYQWNLELEATGVLVVGRDDYDTCRVMKNVNFSL